MTLESKLHQAWKQLRDVQGTAQHELASAFVTHPATYCDLAIVPHTEAQLKGIFFSVEKGLTLFGLPIKQDRDANPHKISLVIDKVATR